MANDFLDKVEDNAIVCIWSEKMQLEKGDSLAKGYVSDLWDYTRISVTQNSLQELNLFDLLDKGVTPVPAILAKTFRSLNACRRAREGRFIEDDVEWRAHWWIPDGILYCCGSFDWVPLLGIWGAVGYAPLLVLRQYNSRQFVPATYGLAQYEFSYRGDNYKKKVKKISQAWNQVHRMKRLAVGSMTTPEYSEWR
ncbi:hypothetical protein Gotur_033618, partial [Gossypium turneri]